MDALAELMTDDRDWLDRALCRGKQRWFFDPPRESPSARARREAVASAICAACPVTEPCRQWARDNREHGFWGGESDEDRTRAGYLPRSIGRRSVLAIRRSEVNDSPPTEVTAEAS